MASASRDRVTIDLRGIGNAVRAAAACRYMGVAQLVRRAVVMSLDLRAMAAVAAGSDGQTPGQAMAKLTPPLPQAHADTLMLNAGALASNDRMATLSTDLVALVTLLRQAKVEQARPYRDRLEAADAEIRRHLDRASALIARL
jgi:hypothetical protein